MRGVGFRTLLRREILRFVRRPRNMFAFENASFSIFHGRWNEYVQNQNTQVLHNMGAA